MSVSAVRTLRQTRSCRHPTSSGLLRPIYSKGKARYRGRGEAFHLYYAACAQQVHVAICAASELRIHSCVIRWKDFWLK